MAVGMGFDLHRLVSGRPLRLGGVTLEFPKGLLGHSDGDVLLHALVDALLGAAGLGDIGDFFPDTDPKWKGASSELFVRAVMAKLRRGWRVVNVDATLLAEAPKLGPRKREIAANMAELLGVRAGGVNLKAKTLEGLGSIGASEAMAAFVVVELKRKRGA